MSGQIPAVHPHHTLRFYIIMSTIIIAGIFFLLVLNNKGDFSLTSAIVKTIGPEGSSLFNRPATEDSSENSEEEISSPDEIEPAAKKEVSVKDESESSVKSSEKKVKSSKSLPRHEADIILTSDQVPVFEEEAQFKELLLRFNDLTTTIRINKDRLELNDEQGMTKTIRIQDGVGNLHFDRNGLFLEITASRFELNDVGIAAKGQIQIVFESPQEYTYFALNGIKAESFEVEGTGNLQVNDRLDYKLVDDKTAIEYFAGSITADREKDPLTPLTTLSGRARGITVSGDALDVDLR